ncbi:MAG: ComF family protein [Clostridia bacterium]|nr:ComF family protein [Clostridia bacterium]MCL6521069.1 ComF family protein [Bacillota bacterium]
MTGEWRAAAGALLALLYPEQGLCQLCGQPLAGREPGAEAARRLARFLPDPPSLCRDCLASVAEESGVCPRCGRPAPPAPGSPAGPVQACPECVAHPPVAARLRCVGVYQGALREAVLALKHGGRTDLARVLGRLMALRLREGLAAPDLLVPMPPSRNGLRRRGYNQAALLAREAAAPWRLPVQPLLRGVDPSGQEGRAREMRRFARAGRFAVDVEVAGARLLLIDDLYATRATLDAAAEALYAAGAARVEALVAAAPLYTGSR